MKIYRVELIDYDEGNLTVGYATTEEKAKKMIEVLKEVDGPDSYDYEYYWVYVDCIVIDGKDILF